MHTNLCRSSSTTTAFCFAVGLALSGCGDSGSSNSTFGDGSTTTETTASTTLTTSTSATETDSVGSEESTGDCAGTFGCSCNPDGTCDFELSCVDDMCVNPECGNGIVDGEDECDDGNDDETDACLNNCVAATCGDGLVHEGREACDDGNDVDDDECTTACSLPSCGDSIVQDPEECDDGNDVNTDECLDTCLGATCGDGETYEGVEECDDANDVNTDACPDTCEAATCGDGFEYEGMEDCDDGNGVNTDDCLDTCMDASCGDGFIQSGVEDCEDMDLDGNDCSTINMDFTEGVLACDAPSCSFDVSQCEAVLNNTNNNCNDFLVCGVGGPHAFQECFTGLSLPQPFLITELAYGIENQVSVTNASIEVYSWANGPGNLLEVQPIQLSDLTPGPHLIPLTNPVQITADAFCIGLRGDGEFTVDRDPGSSNGLNTYLEAPDCATPVFEAIANLGFQGNWCINPRIELP